MLSQEINQNILYSLFRKMNAIAELPYSGDLAAKRRQFMSQPSTVATRRQQAVCVRRAHKQYGSKKNPNIILDGLNMTVPKGSMYVFA